MKKLGFGMMRLPLLNEEDKKSIDKKTVCQMVDTFMERGFTYFDTAYMYHEYESERAMKDVLVTRKDRDSYTLASKLPVMQLKEKEDMERIFNEQREKCGVEYFDYYLLHSLDAEHYKNVKRLDCFGFAMQKKAEGKLGLKSGEGFFDYSGNRGAEAVEARNRKLTAISNILFET